MGTGSDIGGSIRMPAFFCGVFGHKPTWKSVPLTGHFPYEKQDIQSNLRGHRYPLTSVGPLARSAEDLIAMMKLFNQADEIDQEAKLSIEWQTLKKIKGLKVFILPSPKIDKATRTDIELQDVVIKAAQSLKEQGAEIEELSERFFAEAAEVWFALVKSISQRPYHVLLQGPEEIKILREMWNIARGKPRYTLPSLVVSLREKLPLPDSDLAPALAKLSQMRADLVRHLGDNGVLLMPTHPRVAPVHRAPLYRPFDFVYTGIFNALGVPATAVPMGLNKEGLPLGLQVIAKHRRDDLTLFIAQHLETEFGGWKPSRAIY